MRRVSLLNPRLLICLRANNSAFMTHITVLYRFSISPRHNFCILSCLLTTGSAHLYLCTLGTQPHVSDAPLLCLRHIQYHKVLESTSQMCDNGPKALMHLYSVGWGSHSRHVLSTWIMRTDRSSLHVARCRSMVPSTNFLSLQARTRTWSTGASLE